MKRFYENANIQSTETGFTLFLDEKLVRTPAEHSLTMPNKDLADAVAAEWDAQAEEVKPDSMPLTRLANTALDRVDGNEEEILTDILVYIDSDLLCYYADHPKELAELQAKKWKPWCEWIEQTYGAKFIRTEGVVHQEQPQETFDAIARAISKKNPFELAALHNAVSLSGSVILGIAFLDGELSGEEVFELCELDTLFQMEKWGQTPEAMARHRELKVEFEALEKFISLLG